MCTRDHPHHNSANHQHTSRGGPLRSPPLQKPMCRWRAFEWGWLVRTPGAAEGAQQQTQRVARSLIQPAGRSSPAWVGGGTSLGDVAKSCWKQGQGSEMPQRCCKQGTYAKHRKQLLQTLYHKHCKGAANMARSRKGITNTAKVLQTTWQDH